MLISLDKNNFRKILGYIYKCKKNKFFHETIHCFAYVFHTFRIHLINRVLYYVFYKYIFAYLLDAHRQVL